MQPLDGLFIYKMKTPPVRMLHSIGSNFVNGFREVDSQLFSKSPVYARLVTNGLKSFLPGNDIHKNIKHLND